MCTTNMLKTNITLTKLYLRLADQTKLRSALIFLVHKIWNSRTFISKRDTKPNITIWPGRVGIPEVSYGQHTSELFSHGLTFWGLFLCAWQVCKRDCFLIPHDFLKFSAGNVESPFKPNKDSTQSFKLTIPRISYMIQMEFNAVY